jgi:hypothetical protein
MMNSKYDGVRRTARDKRNNYFRLRKLYIKRYFKIMNETNEIKFKKLASKCVQAFLHFLVETGITKKQFFESVVVPKLHNQRTSIGYKSFIKYIDAIRKEEKSSDVQIMVANILIESVFESVEMMNELFIRLQGAEKTIYFKQPLEKYNRYIEEKKKYKEMYFV